MTVQDVLTRLSARAPLPTAELWDNVGLLVGSAKTPVRGAVVSIDLTQDAIALAVKKKANLIVNHHPCIFPRSRGLRCVTDAASPSAALVHAAARHGIAVAAFHTNFDRCAMEVVKTVSSGLGVSARGRLIERSGPGEEGPLSKLVVFVPSTHAEAVRAAICAAGAGQVGDYDFCTFGAPGTGTYRGGASTRPFLGQAGKLEQAAEIRLETIFPTGLQSEVVKALLRSHPYEEVAYDVYALKQETTSLGLVRGLGYGFWGEFKSPRPLAAVADAVQALFKLDGFWLTEPSAPDRKQDRKKIRKLAFVAGKGSSFLDAAVSAGCDLFITGETGYHPALDAARKGMAVMELGHRESERFFLTTMEGWLSELGSRGPRAVHVCRERAQRIHVGSHTL